jgi:hypothetical protein
MLWGFFPARAVRVRSSMSLVGAWASLSSAGRFQDTVGSSQAAFFCEYEYPCPASHFCDGVSKVRGCMLCSPHVQSSPCFSLNVGLISEASQEHRVSLSTR